MSAQWSSTAQADIFLIRAISAGIDWPDFSLIRARVRRFGPEPEVLAVRLVGAWVDSTFHQGWIDSLRNLGNGEAGPSPKRGNSILVDFIFLAIP